MKSQNNKIAKLEKLITINFWLITSFSCLILYFVGPENWIKTYWGIVGIFAIIMLNIKLWSRVDGTKD